jgi:hypothetical protein
LSRSILGTVFGGFIGIQLGFKIFGVDLRSKLLALGGGVLGLSTCGFVTKRRA